MAILRRSLLSNSQKPYTSVDLNHVTPEDVRNRAQSLSIQTVPLDIERVVKGYNIDLVREAMADELSGFLENRGDGWVIGVNALHHPRRQRFSIAHELAHFLLHRSHQEGFRDRTFLRYKDEASSSIESEADRFAGELLMPESEFRSVVAKGVTSVEDIANHFDTSSMAIRYRAKQLGFLKSGV
jgi:Zn-dependent peptidase ImmA (M78 family)